VSTSIGLWPRFSGVRPLLFDPVLDQRYLPTMRSAAARPLMSEKEFLRLPETTDKVEFLDGEVIVSPSPNFWHQEILGRMVNALRNWAGKQRRVVTIGQSPLDVRFGKSRILQPDAFVLWKAIDPKHKGPIAQVPELCIEVVSSDRMYDRVTKRFVYGAAGVRELWVVEPAGLVERWSGRGLAERVELRARLVSPLLPGFTLDLKKLFAVRGRA
jgi:Uma2 family endonuclease